MRVSFENDYSEGCLPEIIESLQNTNYEQTHGYGLDDYSIKAKQIGEFVECRTLNKWIFILQ